jgi:hypothetical protein
MLPWNNQFRRERMRTGIVNARYTSRRLEPPS